MTKHWQAPLEEVQLKEISKALANDELVIIPTETVYGLAASAFSPTAIQSIFDAKQRPASNPVIVHIASVETLPEVVANIPEIATQLAVAFWPGPLTMVFEKSDALPLAVCAGGNTVGVRIPRQETTQKIIEHFGPIAAPSANLYTQLSPTSVGQLDEKLLNSVTIVVDGGPTQVGIESTVLSVVDNIPVLLRPGMVSRKAIETVIGIPVSYKKTAVDDNEERISPGLSKKHYSPKTPVVLGTPSSNLNTRVGFISYKSPILDFVSKQVVLADTPDAYASEIYSTMHLLDTFELDTIYIEILPDDESWQALRDRLERASH